MDAVKDGPGGRKRIQVSWTVGTTMRSEGLTRPLGRARPTPLARTTPPAATAPAPSHARPGGAGRALGTWSLVVAVLLALGAVALVEHSSGSHRAPVAVDAGRAQGTTPGSGGGPATGPTSGGLTTPLTSPRATPSTAPPPPTATSASSRVPSGAGPARPPTSSAATTTTTSPASLRLTTLADLHFASASVGWISGQQSSQAFVVATRDGG